MLDEIVIFLRSPELKPAIWLLGGYLGLYGLMLVATSICVSVRRGEPPRPFTDQIVHVTLLLFFLALSLLTIYIAVWLHRSPLYFPGWYHYATYAVFLVINLLLMFRLFPKVRAK